jgi:hypothetical protein
VSERDSLVSDVDTGKIRVLEETVVWILTLASKQNSDSLTGVITSGFRQDLLTTFEHCNVTFILKLNSSLNILSA